MTTPPSEEEEEQEERDGRRRRTTEPESLHREYRLLVRNHPCRTSGNQFISWVLNQLSKLLPLDVLSSLLLRTVQEEEEVILTRVCSQRGTG